ncbi:hypothetical protein QM996_00795 [Sinorhizobium chiapasense]
MARMRPERLLFVALAAAIVGMALEHQLLEMGRLATLIGAAGLVIAIVLASLRVSHHAEVLASKVGDPYGTMILTLSAILMNLRHALGDRALTGEGCLRIGHAVAFSRAFLATTSS